MKSTTTLKSHLQDAMSWVQDGVYKEHKFLLSPEVLEKETLNAKNKGKLVPSKNFFSNARF